MTYTEKQIVPIISIDDVHLIDARTLHDQLQPETRFNDWINRRIKDYGFIEGEDYYSNLSNQKLKGRGGNRKPLKDYHLTLDMAKEIAMLERSPMGRVIRQYFIETEKTLLRKNSNKDSIKIKEARKACRTLELGTRMLYHYRDAQRLLGFSPRAGITRTLSTYGSQFELVNKQYYVSEEYLQLMVLRAKARHEKQAVLQAPKVGLPDGWGAPLNLELL